MFFYISQEAVNTGVRDDACSWKLLDCMFAKIGNETIACDESEIEAFIQFMDTESSLATSRMFADFLRFVKLSEWDYRFNPRGKTVGETGAYPLKDFAVIQSGVAINLFCKALMRLRA